MAVVLQPVGLKVGESIDGEASLSVKTGRVDEGNSLATSLDLTSVSLPSVLNTASSEATTALLGSEIMAVNCPGGESVTDIPKITMIDLKTVPVLLNGVSICSSDGNASTSIRSDSVNCNIACTGCVLPATCQLFPSSESKLENSECGKQNFDELSYMCPDDVCLPSDIQPSENEDTEGKDQTPPILADHRVVCDVTGLTDSNTLLSTSQDPQLLVDNSTLQSSIMAPGSIIINQHFLKSLQTQNIGTSNSDQVSIIVGNLDPVASSQSDSVNDVPTSLLQAFE